METPALIVDKDIFEANMDAMTSLLSGTTLKLRPHYKSNKCAAIARRQIEHGAVGITCAKLSEALDLCDAGIENILIANQITDGEKIFRVALLAKKCHLIICVDDKDNARALSAAAVSCGSTVYCYVEYEIGMRRCGIEDDEEYIETAELIRELPGLKYAGIQAYAGHVSHMVTEEERREHTEKEQQKIRALKEKLIEHGFPKDLDISGGSTGTAVIKAAGGLYTELQAGSYLFLDSTYGGLQNLPFKNSLYVLSTVVSVRGNRVMLDAGVKSIGVDQGMPAVLKLDGTPVRCSLVDANEEHVKLFDPDTELKNGEKVLLIPGHCCSTVNLYDKMYFVSGGKVVDRLGITARGCSR